MRQASLSGRARCGPSSTTWPFRPGARGFGGRNGGRPPGSGQWPSVRSRRGPRGSVFVLCSSRRSASPYARRRLGKPLPRWWAWEDPPPRVRAPGRPGFACGAAPRLGVSLPASSSEAALGDPGVAVPGARAPTPRSMFLGFPKLGVRPALRPAPASPAPHFLGGTYSLCALPEPAQGAPSPSPSQGLGCSGLPGGGGKQRGSVELGSCGLRGGARGGGRGGPRGAGGAADPSSAFRSPPRAAASSRFLGAGQEGRVGAGRWRLLPSGRVPATLAQGRRDAQL